MRRPLTKRKCQHCKTFFDPDPRSAGRQHYCATPACRKASKAASQRWSHACRARQAVATGAPGVLATAGLACARCVTRTLNTARADRTTT